MLFLKQIGFGLGIVVVSISVALLIINVTSKKGIDTDVTYNKTGVNTFVAHINNTSFTANQYNKATDDSINQRDIARSSAGQFIKEDTSVLLFGVGVGQYNKAYKNKYHSETGAPNNVIVEQIVQTGLVGLGILIALATSLLISLLRTARKLQREALLFGLCFALLAYFIAVVAQLQTFSGIGLTHLWVAIGISIFLVQLPQQSHDKISKKISTKKIRAH